MSIALRQAASGLQEMCNDINGLLVLNVDPEATAYAVEIVEALGRMESLFGEFADFILEVKQFKDHAESFDAGMEAFLRAFLGDPLGKLNETNAQTRQLEARRLQFVNRWKAFEETANKVGARELAVRASLSQKYNREYPRLDSSYEAAKKGVATVQTKVLTQACEAYRISRGNWPPSLAALLQQDEEGGPYLKSQDAMIDPWGQPYQYNSAGPNNGGRQPDIWANAPNGQQIGNWQGKQP
jgi:hypothetical protein